MAPRDLSFIPARSRIAIVGTGYVGSCVASLLAQAPNALKLHVAHFNRNTWQAGLTAEPFDYILNAAGLSGDFRNQPLQTVESNLGLTTHILNVCVPRKAYLALSSTRVYGFGDANQPAASEDSALPPLNPHTVDTLYDGSKILLESLVLHAGAKLGFTPVVARLSNIYGHFKTLDDKTLIKKMVRLAAESQTEPFALPQPPQSFKDYIYAPDAAEGLLRALVLAPQSGGIFNIASGHTATLAQVTEDLTLKTTYGGTGAILGRTIATQKAQNLLGFTATTGLQQGLTETLNSWRTAA